MISIDRRNGCTGSPNHRSGASCSLMTSSFAARNASSVRFGACRAGAGPVIWNRVSNIRATHAVARDPLSVRNELFCRLLQWFGVRASDRY